MRPLTGTTNLAQTNGSEGVPALPRAPELELPHQTLFSITPRTPVSGWGDTVSVFQASQTKS